MSGGHDDATIKSFPKTHVWKKIPVCHIREPWSRAQVGNSSPPSPPPPVAGSASAWLILVPTKLPASWLSTCALHHHRRHTLLQCKRRTRNMTARQRFILQTLRSDKTRVLKYFFELISKTYVFQSTIWTCFFEREHHLYWNI